MAKRRMCRGWLFITILVSIGLQLSATSPKPVGQSKRQILLDQAKKNFDSDLGEIANVGLSLERKKSAHEILSLSLLGSEPEVFMKELEVESGILAELIQQNDLILQIIGVAKRLANGEALATNFSEVTQKFALVDRGLKELQDTLESNRGVRQTYKTRLNQLVDARTAANPAKVQSLAMVKVELDPENLDLNLQQQRTIISSAIATLNLLN